MHAAKSWAHDGCGAPARSEIYKENQYVNATPLGGWNNVARIAFGKAARWDLADTLILPETISAWSLSSAVARQFKRGVPNVGWQGVIFLYHSPTHFGCREF